MQPIFTLTKEPIVPESLEQAQMLALRSRSLRKLKMKQLPHFKDTDTVKTPREKVQLVTKPGRPTIMFVDVGGKFMDDDEEKKRAVAAERRVVQRIKAITRPKKPKKGKKGKKLRR